MSGPALRCEIAIVGGGIVGAAAACALSRAGFDVQLLERGAAPVASGGADYDVRVYAISAGSAAFLADLGLWADISATRVEPIRSMQIWDRDPAKALRFDAADVGVASLGWILEDRRLAQRLWAALPPGCARTGTALRRARFDADPDMPVRLELSDGSTLRADLVVGAEGADSPLREAAGIDVAGWSYGSSALVCHVECSQAHRGAALQRFLPSGPVALLPLADGRRSLVWSTTQADAQALLALDDASFARQLQDAMQSAAGDLRAPTPRRSFPLRLLHAQRYVAPRCVLLGDSAHVVHPLAGQGLNLGLAEAMQLAVDLGAARQARRDWSAMRTLQRYERARQADNLEMLALTDTLARAFALDFPGWRRLLTFGMRTVDRLSPLKNGLAMRAARSA